MEQTQPIRECVSNEVAQKRQALFDKYIMPYQRMVYKLCLHYTNRSSDVRDNYVEVLTNLYKYIETYDTSRPLVTWIHIVTKRCVYDLDQKRKKQKDMRNDDTDIEDFSDSNMYESDISERVMGVENYREFLSDDVLNALDQLKPQYRRAFIYQQAGYKLKEIAEKEFKNGALDSRNIETVKSRLFLARQQLKQLLTRDGKRRTEVTSEY